MRRSLFGLLTATLLATACGGGDGTDTTEPSAQSPDTTQTETTPVPETMETTATTSPETTTTTAASGYDYGYDRPSDGSDQEEEAGDESEEAGPTAIGVAESELGEILVGPDGMTLYVFLPDEQGESTCYDSCASTWPPVEGDVGAAAGLEEDKLGTVERTDGSAQATYNGWPLYYYAGDVQPGDVEGQGVGGNWFVIDVSGEVVEG